MKRFSANDLKQIARNALMHYAVVWGGLVVIVTLRYAYVVLVHGVSWQLNADGTHTAISQYLLQQILHPETVIFLIAAFLIEVCYTYLFKGLKFYWFLGVCLLLGLTIFLANLLRMVRYYDLYNNIDWIGPIMLIAAYLLLYCWIRDYFYQRAYYKDLQLQHSQNQLNALKAQVNPHFLFNSLNYLYGTALKEQAAATAEGIERLASMMRYSIAGMNENFVPLENELEFIRNYINMQQNRIPVTGHINISVHIGKPGAQLSIAPLLLLPFIENAFKYGISNDEPCRVAIDINIKDAVLVMQVDNTIMKNALEVKGNNTGILNTVKRLDLLYQNKYLLKQNADDQQYHTSLSLSLSPVS